MRAADLPARPATRFRVNMARGRAELAAGPAGRRRARAAGTVVRVRVVVVPEGKFARA